MIESIFRGVSSIALMGMCVQATNAADIVMERHEDRVEINAGDDLFAVYLINSGNKPVVWPIIGPSGHPLTRAYPIKDGVLGEKRDHVHHRSLWFTHGDVNGVSFWDEGRGAGRTVHREFVKVAGGSTGQIVTRNDWLAPDGGQLLEDTRILRFRAEPDARVIDFDITLTATTDQVAFGDTKEGTFGVRVAGSMRMDANQGGQITTSEGLQGEKAWGTKAAWVDYNGPVAGERMGIAILNHPSSFRYPTYWHVRTYGLFAANPFGWHDFVRNSKLDGSLNLEQGESVTFRYRVIFHKGDEQQGNIQEAFDRYAAENLTDK